MASGLDLALRRHVRDEALGEGIDGAERIGGIRCHVLGLVVGIGLVATEFGIRPELIRDLDTAIAALPDQRGIGLAAIFRLIIRSKIIFMF